VFRRLGPLRLSAIALALVACASPSPNPSAGDMRPVDVRAMDECHDFAEQTLPNAPVRGNGAGRWTVYPSRNAESLRTLFDLCMQAKEALK
jgi:hypothetical protein